MVPLLTGLSAVKYAPPVWVSPVPEALCSERPGVTPWGTRKNVAGWVVLKDTLTVNFCPVRR